MINNKSLVELGESLKLDRFFISFNYWRKLASNKIARNTSKILPITTKSYSVFFFWFSDIRGLVLL